MHPPSASLYNGHTVTRKLPTLGLPVLARPSATPGCRTRGRKTRIALGSSEPGRRRSRTQGCGATGSAPVPRSVVRLLQHNEKASARAPSSASSCLECRIASSAAAVRHDGASSRLGALVSDRGSGRDPFRASCLHPPNVCSPNTKRATCSTARILALALERCRFCASAVAAQIAEPRTEPVRDRLAERQRNDTRLQRLVRSHTSVAVEEVGRSVSATELQIRGLDVPSAGW